MNLRDPSTVVLVACSAAKVQSACQAQYLYVGDLFIRSKLLAERSGTAWAILSAKHHLVQPGQMIEPYDQRLTSSKSGLRLWAARVVGQLLSYPAGTHFVLLASSPYRSPFRLYPHVLRAFTWEAPLDGMGIGHQKQWLARELAAVAA